MAHRRRIAAALALTLSFTPALALDGSKVKVLQGPELITAFEGKTVSGAYADGTPVRETYVIGGGITYWDPVLGNLTGQWSVVNNLFCTFYTGMTGGCFRIEQVSSNCFDFYAVADSESEALQPNSTANYTARAAIEGAPSTCPDPLQV